MPVSYNSVARNLFLLGASGADAVVNFFKSVDKSPVVAFTEGNFIPSGGIKYDQDKFLISGRGYANDPFVWIDKRDYDVDTLASTADWENRLQPTVYSSYITLEDMELDSNSNVIVVGKWGGVNGDYGTCSCYIAKYDSAGVVQWQSTSNTGDLQYTGVTSDSNGNYYACGNTPNTFAPGGAPGEAEAFVEKFDGSGAPLWGKASIMLGRDVVLKRISANSRGEVVAVGYLEDDSVDKGYIVKIDTNTGKVLWDRTLERSITGSAGTIPADVRCTSCYIDSNDQIYIVGTVDGNNPVNNGVGEFLIKYTAEGNIVWQRENNTDHYTALDGEPNMIPFDVWSDGETEQTVVLSVEDQGSFALNDSDVFISKYNRNGDIVFRRKISKGGDNLGTAAIDGDPSYYYMVFRDQKDQGLEPDRYTFGKVSSSGNGLGTFNYNDGTGDTNFNGTDKTVDYIAISNPENKIGKMSDGSVSNSSSDLMTYPFTANKLVFDDLATNISNKKRQMDSADSFQYSGSPAIRPADFQELNLLGDVYSGSGDWLDQSGKGNDATTSFTTTTTTSTGGTTSSENFGTGGSITYNTYGTVVEGVTATLPYSTSDWDHYNSKVRDLQSGGFKITTSNAATTDFFMGCWVKFDTYAQSRQMGINLGGNYIYWETLASGKVAVRHNGGNRQDSASGTGIDDGNWHYISLSRAGSTLAGHVDGSPVVSTTSGVSGNSIPTNADFWFFGGSGTSYNIDGKILDPIINIGTGQTGGYTTPTKPIIDSSGNFNGGGSGSGPFFSSSFEYASPAIAIAGSTTTTTTTNGPTYNAAGYWEFDNAGDNIEIGTLGYDYSQLITLEAWIKTTDTDTWNQIVCGEAGDILWAVNQGKLNFGSQTNTPIPHNNQSTASINTGNWVHVLTTFDGANIKHYINGELDSTFAETGSLNANEGTHPLRIGARGTGTGEFYGGEIGEVRIYPRALTRAQVYQNYNATKSKYINEAPDTAPKIGSAVVLANGDLNYDFGNRATYDPVENRFTSSANLLKYSDGTSFGRLTDWSWLGASTPEAIPNAAIAPDGSLTAWKVSGPSLYQSIINDGDFTMSAWVKTVDGSSASVQQSVYLLGTGGDVLSTTHTATGEWQRITFSSVATSIYGNPAGKYHRYTPFSSSADLYVWGPQVELKSSAGRHVQTYGTAITPPTTVKDLSYRSYTGTLDGATFNSNGYMELNAVDSVINAGLASPFSSNNVSFEMWFYPETTAEADSRSMMLTANYEGGYQPGTVILRYDQEPFGTAKMFIAQVRIGTTSEFWQHSTQYPRDNWYHVVWTWNNGTMKLYINGSEKTLDNNTGGPTSGAILNGSGDIYIGENHTYGGTVIGDYGQFRIYTKTLSSTEVSQNFNATRSKYGV